MLEYDRIDISEGIDFKKCKETSKECSLCKFYYFLDKNFRYGPYLCDGCYDMSMKANSIRNLAIINHNGNHYRVNLVFMSKKDAFNLREHYKCRKHKCFVFKAKIKITCLCII